MTHPLLESSSRIALAAYLHDLGKFAERAEAFRSDPRLDAHLQAYCPYHSEGRWFSHRHAAHTALAFDAIERQLPDLLHGDVSPFSGRVTVDDASGIEPTDSLVNAASAHHKPDTFLQWVIATADRVASGFERDEFERYNAAKDESREGLTHYTSRQLTIFEQIRLEGQAAAEALPKWRYPLRAFAPANLFPQVASECESRDKARAVQEYAHLWQQFSEGIKLIPGAHRKQLPLWLDHFDSLWLTYTHVIPAATAFGVKPEVSLYDHSRTTAALAVALWRWHESRGQTDVAAAQALRLRADYGEQKFLLVQGDFFGIQDFVFAAGGETRKHAAKLLRGRSFHVSLFTELAALRILEALGLPSTSQVINAAGKFLIVVPNTPDVLDTLSRIRGEFDAWFLEHTFGQAGLGLAWIPAACQDFLRVQDPTQGFSGLQTKLVRALDVAKHQRFDLAQQAAGVRDADFTHGPCVLNGRLPADGILHPLLGDKKGTCAISRDQLAVGSALVDGFDRLLIVADADAEAVKSGADTRVLEQSLFGYRVAFTRSEAITGKFSAIAADGKLRRCLDFALPDGSDKAGTQTLWNGYARRFISGYVPRLATEDLLESLRERYLNVEDADPLPGDLETFDWLASENRIPRVDEEGKGAGWQGIAALGVIKGDVDDLGEIFRVGMGRPSFAKYAGLSRQLNGFFAIVLPWLLATEYPKVYTVFAGGDDFFLIGPWRTVQKLGARMQVEFARYTSSNAALHFSAGIATQKPGAPVGALADIAEEALASAKQFDGKNAVTCFGVTLGWKDWAAVEGALQRLDELRDEMRLSTGYVYGLLQFLDMHRRELQGEPESAMWRSRLAYRTRRFVVDKLRSPSGKSLDETERQRKFHTLMEDIGNRGIQAHGRRYKIVLFNHLYQRRDR